MAERRDKGSRGLSAEERALWESVTEGLKPLKRQPAKPLTSNKETEPTSGRPAPGRQAEATPPGHPKKPLPLLERGTIADLDKRQAQRLRRGQMPIDGKLDLHGCTQAEAHRRLESFLASAQASGKRCVLVVTGRGLGKSAGGVLRSEVPRWLNQAPNRARVLAFDWAQPKHGGDGALYVLLRRNRPT